MHLFLIVARQKALNISVRASRARVPQIDRRQPLDVVMASARLLGNAASLFSVLLMD